MWSLPNIVELNARAVQEHQRRKGRPPSPRGKECGYCSNKAKYMIPYHDPFGDEKVREIPKGFMPVCRECHDNGRWQEGLFDCADCGKTFIENYTWELYYRDTERGRICLECAFTDALNDPDFWVYEEDVKRLRTYLDQGLHDICFRWICEKAKHLIGVDTVYWKDRLIFQENVELDSSSGTRITGGTSSESSIEGGVREIVKHLENVIANTKLRDFMVAQGDPAKIPASWRSFTTPGATDTNSRCALILDGAYQFAVSIGIYFERKYTGARHASA